MAIPDTHADLVECPPVAALTTLMPDGSPQTSVVWCDSDGTLVRVNTMRGFRKERNMRADPRVTILCYDPREPSRYLEVRGRVEEMSEEGALEHLDALASKAVGRPIRYFGGCIPERFAATEVPVLCRIRPSRVVALDARDAPHAGCGCAPDRCESGLDASLPRRAEAGARSPAPPPRAGEQPIPESHLHLLERGICGVLTTLLPGGQPCSCLVWVDHDGTRARISTTLERRAGRNLAADPRLSLLIVDPEDTARFIQIRGTAELVTDGAIEHLDALTRRYTRHPRFYGHIYPEAQAARERRVSVVVHAHRVALDAIHV